MHAPTHSISTRGDISMTKDNYWLSLAPLALISARGVSVCVCRRGRVRGQQRRGRRNRGDLMKGAEWENAPTDPQCTNRRGGWWQRKRNHLLNFSFFNSSSMLLFCVLHFLVSVYSLPFHFSHYFFLSAYIWLILPLSCTTSSLHYHNLRGWKAWRVEKEEKERWEKGETLQMRAFLHGRGTDVRVFFVKRVGEGRR